MKIFQTILFCVCLHFIHTTIVLKKVGTETVPESNKLQIQFSRSGQPIQILTNHKISSLKADTEVQVDKSIYQDALQGESEPAVEEDIYDEHYDDMHGGHIFPTIQDHHDDAHMGFLDDLQQQIFDLTNQPQTKQEKHVNVAYSQLGELEDSLKDVLYKTEGKTAVMMNPKVLQTLVSYLEHLDYIHKQENGGKDQAPPKIPDHFRSDGIQINQENPQVTTEKKVSDLEHEVEAEITEKEHEKDAAHDKLHKNQEEEFNLEKEIEGLRAEIDNLKTEGEGTNEEAIQQKEEEIKQLEDEIHIKKEEDEDIKTEENLDATEIEVEQAEETVEKQDNDQGLIDTLEHEKDQLENQEHTLQEEEKQYESIEEVQERLAKIDEQLSHLMESQPDSSLVGELEEEKKRLLIKEDELKNEIGKEHHEEDQHDEHNDEDHHDIADEGEHHDEEHHDEEHHDEEHHEENHEDEIDQYTKDEMAITPNIHEMGKIELRLTQIKKQLIELYKDLPSNSKDIPTDIVTEYKSGLLLYQHLQTFNENFSIYRKQFTTDTTYLSERLSKIQLDFHSVLDFYEMDNRYKELTSTIKKDDSNFIMKEEETKVIVNQFATHIDTATMNINSIKNLFELLKSNLEPIEEGRDEKDEDIDMIQKVELTFKLLPTLLELRQQIETAIKEAQISLTRINQKTAQLEAIMESLAKIQSGELKGELNDIENSADKKNSSSALTQLKKVLTIAVILFTIQVIQKLIFINKKWILKNQRNLKSKKNKKK